MSKKIWAVALTVVAIVFSAYVTEADARRMGGGRSVGQQNTLQQRTPPQQATTPGQQAGQSAAMARQQNQAAAQTQNRSRWMAPLAGLAAGLGLAALASWLGFGEEFATMMMILLLVMVALFAFRFFMARRAAQGGNNRGGLAYEGAGAAGPAGNGRQTDARFQLPGNAATRGTAGAAGAGAAGAGAAGGAGGASGARPEADIDADQFVRAARAQFVRLQSAFDTGRSEELREFTSPQMYGELQNEIAQRGGQAQTTEILTLNAEFLGSERYGAGGAGEELAAVRFTGLLRESADEAAQQIDEVWNFSRPVDRRSGWVLAGIQQHAG